MRDQFLRKKRSIIIFGRNFVILAIVYSDDSYENLRIYFSFFCVIFSSFFHPGMLFKYELKMMFTTEPKVHSCVSEWSRVNRKHIISTDKTTDVWSRHLCIYRGIISPKKMFFSLFRGQKKVFEFFF